MLAERGLMLRGGFRFDAGEEAPAGPGGGTARSLLLVGNAGTGMWREFSAWLDRQPDIMADPLDTWSAEVIDAVAARIGARAVYPSQRPWQPFQRWAMRAEGLRASPTGVLIHPRFGLWHAYRAALLLDVEIPIQAPEELNHPCATCVEQPCLSSCPVGAYSVSGFDVARCAGHAGTAAGHACREAGCLARNACPVGADMRSPAAQQAFHMAAFLSAHPAD
ncbi:MAG: hypothetical protein WAT70_13670 [Rhizobiaceae bacterium]